VPQRAWRNSKVSIARHEHSSAAVQFTRAIARLPSENLSAGIASPIGGGNPDSTLALAQHGQYCNALRACGLQVEILPADARHPDSTFIEDTAVLTSHAAIITRPGASSRLGETAITLVTVRGLFETIRQIRPPGTLDGGDVCEVDGQFIIGLSERTNAEGIRQLTAFLAEFGYKSLVIDIRECKSLLHLKSGMSYIGGGVFVISPETPFAEALAQYQLITVAAEESYAANCVRVNEQVLLAAGFPRTAETLTAHNFRLLTVPMSEFRKMDGGLSCLSLRF
jgi:dimethylargininase